LGMRRGAVGSLLAEVGAMLLGGLIALGLGRPFSLADPSEAGACAGAVEEAVQVAIRHPGSGGSPYHAEHDVEDRVGQGVVDAGSGEEVI
jgi:hypothetical protein